MNIVITGSSKGIGRAIAEEFASDKQGNHIFICSRTKEQIDLVGRELQGRFPRASIYTQAVDLSVKEQAISFGNNVISKMSTIDVLVNNAGVFVPGSICESEDDTLQSQLNTNLLSAYYLTRVIATAMKKRKSGHIFNICSVAGLKAYENGGAYSISKFALNGFSQNLREELKPFGIKVTAIHPGAAMTGSWDGFDNSNKRIMEAADIAKMVYAAAHLSTQACVEDIVIRPQLGDL